MRKIFVITILLCGTINIVFAQQTQSLTFKVEKLKKPKKTLPEETYDNICEDLILGESGIGKYTLEKNQTDFPFGIIAKSKMENKLVDFGFHSFFDGMYYAYAEHRPFVISPDMIWLLISQGFSHHVNVNSDTLRHHFVDFSGKTTLLVETKTELTQITEQQWEKIFPRFTQQIAQHTGNELINTLTADFSTTTPVEKVASEITIMHSLKSYFDYTIKVLVCGIPEITLQGTTEDWEKVLKKTQQLSKYDLTWWTSELEPVLKKIIETSKGEIDKDFWRNMFKYHTVKSYGSPKIVDGWIVKFFPYDKDGKRKNLKELTGITARKANLPEEIAKVDLLYVDELTKEEISLELWAGFVGLEQNKKDFTLTPKIGWFVRKKDLTNKGRILYEKMKFEWEKNYEINLYVSEVPEALLLLDSIETLFINFTDKIIIPDKLSTVIIRNLFLFGKIEDTEIERLKQMFPNSGLFINGIEIYPERLREK